MELSCLASSLHNKEGPLSSVALQFLTGAEVLNADAAALKGAAASDVVIGCLGVSSAMKARVDVAGS